MKFSIIIPAYNAEKYISRCIDSLVNQSLNYNDYEAIVINDGSIDNTEKLLIELSEKYSIIKYITRPNGGLSNARNTGISMAKGDFLIFLDSDDAIEENTLCTIYNEITKEKLDMMLVDYTHIAKDSTEIPQLFRMEQNPIKICSGKDFLLNEQFPPMVWTYIYKRQFIEKHNLKMKKIGHEDEEFTPRALYFAERIKYFPIKFYKYYQNGESYMESYKESNCLYMIEAMASLNIFSSQNCNEPEIKSYFKHRIARSLMHLFKNSIKRGYRNQKEMSESVIRNNLLPLLPYKKNYYYYLFNISPMLFVRWYKFIKRK